MRQDLTPPETQDSATASVPNRSRTASAHPKRRVVLAWALVFCWGTLIWILGGDSFSFTDTNETIIPWLDWLTGSLDYRTRYRIYVGIRKSAHFIEYAILALLTFRAALLAARKTQLATAGWVALFIVASLATADEARQAFSTVRTGSPYDVLLDVAGGLIAVLGVLIISRRFRPDAKLERSA
jgi:VanZ family protein